MPNYFSKFPKIDYVFADGTRQQMTDINVKLQLSREIKTKSDAFYPYAWQEQDRPDTIADAYYNSDSMYWLVLQSNNVYDVNHDLPMREQVFTKYLLNKYKDKVETPDVKSILDYMSSTVHHYEDENGYVIDEQTFQQLGNTKVVTIFDYEFSLNESKRRVQLIDDEIARKVKNELEDKLRKITSERE